MHPRLRNLKSAKKQRQDNVPFAKVCYHGTSSDLKRRAAKYMDDECKLSGSASEDESVEEDDVLSGSFINDGPITQPEPSQGEFLHRLVDREEISTSTDGLFDIRFGNRRILLHHLKRALNKGEASDNNADAESDGCASPYPSLEREVSNHAPRRFLDYFDSQDLETFDEW